MLRVYASGEGEYLIDGSRVRLKDVREMLFGTGLGSRGYSVLEQGKIDAILSANPLERRAIFEEAAGISRYRARKKETESRLERVRADCLRLDDVLGELDAKDREVILLRGIEQLSLPAVAAQLGASEAAVAKRYQRAIAKLRARLPGSAFDELADG